jgi:hypothetical protein
LLIRTISTYDAAHKRLYISFAEGVVGVFEQRAAGHGLLASKDPSVPESGTGFLVPEFNRIHMMCWGAGREGMGEEYAELLRAAEWVCGNPANVGRVDGHRGGNQPGRVNH